MIFTKGRFIFVRCEINNPRISFDRLLKFYHSRNYSEERFIWNDKLIGIILNRIEIVSNRKIYTESRDFGFLINFYF